jgi:hypothetical protein
MENIYENFPYISEVHLELNCIEIIKLCMGRGEVVVYDVFTLSNCIATNSKRIDE